MVLLLRYVSVNIPDIIVHALACVPYLSMYNTKRCCIRALTPGAISCTWAPSELC